MLAHLILRATKVELNDPSTLSLYNVFFVESLFLIPLKIELHRPL